LVRSLRQSMRGPMTRPSAEANRQRVSPPRQAPTG
jgi:hypothetical protein